MSVLPDYPEALRLALGCATPLGGAQIVDLPRALGRVLAEPLRADRDLPPFDRAEMDGYALRAEEFSPGRAWPVAATIAAGAMAPERIPPGSCVAIATGAALPAGLDAVVAHELSDRGDPVRFELPSVAAGRCVHRRGADARSGQTLVAPGAILGPHHLGIAAGVGVSRVGVRRRPRVIVITSGDEIVERAPAPHQIRNSNAPMVTALLARMGAEPAAAVHVPDDAPATRRAVAEALPACDLLVTVGGVSAGERDHLPDALRQSGAAIALQGAAIQPGRPILVGRAGACMIVGLPGNPVSALACACLFVWPIVRALLGVEAELPWTPATLAHDVKANPQRRAFRPALLDGAARVTVPRWSGSGDLAHTAPTHGLAELPRRAEPVAAGTAVRFLPYP
jgi:molybdopterin molybdotransferase